MKTDIPAEHDIYTRGEVPGNYKTRAKSNNNGKDFEVGTGNKLAIL